MYLRIFFAAIFLVSSSYAEEEIAQQSVPIRLTREEEEEHNENMYRPRCCPSSRPQDPCAPVCCKPPSSNCPPIMPRCNPCDCILDYYNPLIFNGWDTSLELLVWTVSQQASNFVLNTRRITLPPPTTTLMGSGWGTYEPAKFGWNAGVRVNLGYTFQRDAWHLGAQYTFFSTHDSTREEVLGHPSIYLEPTLSAVPPQAEREAKCKTRFASNLLDLALQRTFLPACQILIDCSIGLTAAFLNEKIDAKYAAPLPAETTTVDNHWSYSSGGIRAGLNTNWHMGCGFGLFSKFSFAELIGSYNYHQKVEIYPPNPTLIDPLRNVRQTLTVIVPTTQFALGLDWNHRFCNWALKLLLGFEVNTFFDIHQMALSQPAFDPPQNSKIAYRDQSNLHLWGTNIGVDFSY